MAQSQEQPPHHVTEEKDQEEVSSMKKLISGSARSTSSDSSSDLGDRSTESLTELNASLKLAQSRKSTLSTNYARLLRLVLDDELEIVDREIAQIRNGTYEPLRKEYREALEACEAKYARAKYRRVATEHEIDTRFGAMIEAEWSQFHVSFLFTI
jgi:uncharacterized protein involved in exopolysaccharide biosynthesis